MRRAETILAIIRKYGQYKLPMERVYSLLYNPSFYLMAYGKIYRNNGAMTKGITEETVDGMSLDKIEKMISLLKQDKYKWFPSKRIYIEKKNGKLRPLGLPVWCNKLLQEVIRLILEAYYEPQYSIHSHGFRPNRGCHTALKEIKESGNGTKWFIEGDIQGCFNEIDHEILLDTLRKNFHDNRFINLLSNLLKAGYLEDWKYNLTNSGVAQGSICGPVLSNIMLDHLDKYVEKELIPAYTYGLKRKPNPSYAQLMRDARKAKENGDWKGAVKIKKKAQQMPSKDLNDPNFRRLWYVRYADDFLLGFIGPRNEALTIKEEIKNYLSDNLKLKMSEEKTLITHARTEKARFLGYDVCTLHENSKHNKGNRCINGKIGLLVPCEVRNKKCVKYTKYGKPKKLPERSINDVYTIISDYQAEYRGVIQYYKMAHNLHTLNKLKYVMETSLVKTLACKQKTTCRKIYKKYGTTMATNDGTYKVIMTKVYRPPPKKPLTTYFGGISLKRDRNAILGNNMIPIWNTRSELVKRLLAEKCELCGSKENIEVHHIRKLKDITTNKPNCPEWKKKMIARRRKTLIVCQKCHESIHYGKYDGEKIAA